MSRKEKAQLILQVRFLALLVILYGGAMMGLSSYLEPVERLSWDAFLGLDLFFSREGGLIYGFCFFVSGVGLMFLERWGLIVMFLCYLLFAGPVALIFFRNVTIDHLRDPLLLVELAPTCLLPLLGIMFLRSLWRTLGKIQ